MRSGVYVVTRNGTLRALKVFCIHCGKEVYIVANGREETFSCPYCRGMNRIILTKHGYILLDY